MNPDRLTGSRRGVEVFQVLVIVAVFAVVSLLIILILQKIYAGSVETLSDRETCRLSVLGHAATQLRVDNLAATPELISIDCKRRLVTVGNHNIEVNGKSATFYDGKQDKFIKQYDAPSPSVVDAVVADELAGCWYQFLSGKQDFLGDYIKLFSLNTKRSCFVCSEISFDPGARASFVNSGNTPFFDYIKEVKVRKLIDQQQPTLYKYMFNDETKCFKDLYADPGSKVPCVENFLHVYATDWTGAKPTTWVGDFFRGVNDRPLQMSPQFSPEKSYAVVFFREGGNYLAERAKAYRKSAATVGIPLVGPILSALAIINNPKSESASTYFAWVMDADTLNSNTCDEYFA
jgi:hypothetical protein